MTAKEQKTVLKARERRVHRVRLRIKASAEVPVLSVYRSNKHISVQIIDLKKRSTIASSSDARIKATGTKTERAAAVGKDIAQQAKKHKVTRVVFDRSWYRFHGRLKALADAATAEGLQFEKSEA